MTRVWLVLAMLLLPVQSWAQDAPIVDALRAARAAKPTPMSKEQIADVLNRTAAQFPGWGMLRKDYGNNCPTPYPGVSISCDWLVNAPTRWGYDVIADQEGAGEIKPGHGEALSAGQEIVYPWPTDGVGGGGSGNGGGNPQNPVGGAVTPDVIRAIVASEVDKVYAQNERIFANVSDNLLAILGREDLLAKQLEAHDQKVNKLVAFFSNGKTITALASFFSAYVALKQTQGAN